LDFPGHFRKTNEDQNGGYAGKNQKQPTANLSFRSPPETAIRSTTISTAQRSSARSQDALAPSAQRVHKISSAEL
jgi:hypothetical protein